MLSRGIAGLMMVGSLAASFQAAAQGTVRQGGVPQQDSSVVEQEMREPPPPPPPPPVPGASTIASKIEEQGRMLYLTVSDLRAARRDNLLRIQAEITNVSADNQQLYYRFKWLDNDGFTVWDEEPWKPMIVYGRQKQIINVVAPTFKATDFRLVLQSPANESR
jgi:uncharacterized protein YcfL